MKAGALEDRAAQQVDAPDKVRAGSKPRPLQVIHVLGERGVDERTLEHMEEVGMSSPRPRAFVYPRSDGLFDLALYLAGRGSRAEEQGLAPEGLVDRLIQDERIEVFFQTRDGDPVETPTQLSRLLHERTGKAFIPGFCPTCRGSRVVHSAPCPDCHWV